MSKNVGVFVQERAGGSSGSHKKHEPLDLVYGAVPMPAAPTSNEVTIEMRSIGICGSDVHYWQHGRIGDFIVKAPMVLGHESSGRVVAVGSAVTHLKVGDRVTIEPGVPCRRCAYCKGGRYNLCRDVQFLATPPVQGSMAKYVNHASDFCYKLPDHVSYEEGAMCEPLSVGVFACQRGGVKPGSSVLITGAGPIGLMCLIVAKAFGAAHVTVLETRPARAAFAKQLGADSITAPTTQVDVSMECTGAPAAISNAIKMTKSGGVVCLVGLGPAEVTLPLVDAAVREVDIRGIFRYHNTYPLALAMIATRRVDVKPVMTHHYPFTKEAVDMAFRAALNGQDDKGKTSVKVMVNIGSDKDVKAKL